MNRNRTVLLILLLAAITFISYLPSLKNDFVNYDDNIMVINNSDIRDLSAKGIAKMFSGPHAGLYHPFVTLSYALEYKIAGLNPHVFHATNLLLHLFNCALVFMIIFLMTSNPAIAFAVALLFGIHPLHVESVAWISERKDTLYSLFYLLSIICYQLYVKRTEKKWYIFSVALFVFSLLSKPMAVTLPVILFLLDYYESRKFSVETVSEKIPFIMLSSAFSIVAVIFHRASGWTGVTTAGTLLSGIYRAFNGLIFYLSKIFAPVNLVHTYVDSEILSQWFGIFDFSIIFVVSVVLIALIISKRSRKTAVFGTLFFVVAILPVLQIITNGRAIAADRYTYIPSIGIFFIFASFLNSFTENNRKRKQIAVVIFIFLTAGMSVMTWHRCFVWRDGVSLWTDELRLYPKFVYALNNRGLAYSERGDMDKAFIDYNLAIQVDPGFAHAYNNRGNVYKQSKKYDKALLDYNKAIGLDPHYAQAYFNRGSLNELFGDFNKALSDYSKAIELSPEFSSAYLCKANIEIRSLRYAEAIVDYTEAIKYNQEALNAYINRANTYIALKKYQEALIDLNSSIKLNPISADAYYNRGVLYSEIGNAEMAVFDFTRAISINPRMVMAYVNRGTIYKTMGNMGDAGRDLEKAREYGFKE